MGRHYGKTNYGRTSAPSYSNWINMKKRCNCPTDKNYKNYGRRGIKICERWGDFFNFYMDMGDPPPGTSIDRINNDGDYEPGNCKWSTPKEQCNNRRGNILLTHKGRTQTVAQWAKEYGIGDSVLRVRLKLGWSIDDALTTPKGERRKGE